MRRKKRQERPQLKIVGIYAMVDDARVLINPKDREFSDFQDRCKLALAEMTTGQTHELIKSS